MRIIKMICCLPFLVLGAAIGIVSQCIATGYEWGREEFFEGE